MSAPKEDQLWPRASAWLEAAEAARVPDPGSEHPVGHRLGADRLCGRDQHGRAGDPAAQRGVRTHAGARVGVISAAWQRRCNGQAKRLR